MRRIIRNRYGIAAFCAAVSYVFVISAYSDEPRVRNTAIAPEVSLGMIELDADFSIQLLAHEPVVIDPVDAAFDDQGRLWVVEMRDYPYPTGGTPTGSVRILSDNDGDGRFDTAAMFADQLNMPTGIAIWKDGAVVSMAGQVVWMRDTDGDQKADTRQVWLEGFAKENEQLRANHPRLGPDGWWYIASGLRGGSIVVGKDFATSSSAPLMLGSRDVRFDPTTGQLEAITGPAQFGITFDPVGNRIFCTNRNPAIIVRFEQADLIGNPLAGLVPSVVDVIPSGEQSRVFALVNAWTTSNLHAGQFTAACGVHFHDFNEQAKNSTDPNRPSMTRIFTCEPTGSLVHCSEFIDHISATTRASTSYTNADWLASRDPWFRPVNVIATPDNGVAILDMHRAVIEHPDWVPDELKKRLDERWGNENGRIYHVNRKSLPERGSLLSTLRALRENPLGKRTSEELANLVLSDNAWMRDTARRLIVERNDSIALDALHSATTKNDVSPAAQIQAIYLASRIGNQIPKTVGVHIKRAITGQSVNESVLIAAIRASRPSVPYSVEPKLILELAEKSTDVDVFCECLRTIGTCDMSSVTDWEDRLTPRLVEHFSVIRGDALATLIVNAGSAYRARPGRLLQAILNGVSKNALLREPQIDAIFLADAGSKLAMACLEKLPDSRAEQVANVLPPISLAVHLQKSNPASTAVALSAFSEFLKKPGMVNFNNDQTLNTVWDSIRAIAEDESVGIQIRNQSLAALARSPREQDRNLLLRLVQDAELPVQLAALRAWSTTDDQACDQYLLESLRRSSPKFQLIALELIAQKQPRLNALAKMVAEGEVPAKQIGAIELKKLVTRAKDEAKKQLTMAMDSLVNYDRAKVLATYQPCLELKAEPMHGKAVFAKHCAGCHKIDNIGVQVGPDISDLRTQQPSQILTSILDPNRVIDNNYFRYTALTDDDQVVDGIIAEETVDTIVIRGQNNTRSVLQRAKLQELKATGISMMPEGVESQIDLQAMADLIAFVKGWRYLDGSIPKKE
jgi:putative membrane-bound dehydrogenase-like protein